MRSKCDGHEFNRVLPGAFLELRPNTAHGAVYVGEGLWIGPDGREFRFGERQRVIAVLAVVAIVLCVVLYSIERAKHEEAKSRPLRFSLAVLAVIEHVVPTRVAAEEIGDTHEKLTQLRAKGASTWRKVLVVVAGAVWASINAIGEVVGRLKGSRRGAE